MDWHFKAAMRVAKKIATGTLTDKQKAKRVSQWAQHMKALIKEGRK